LIASSLQLSSGQSGISPQGLVENIKSYATKFPNVYQIWDSNKAKNPSYNFPNQIETYEKKYGTTFSGDLKIVVDNMAEKFPDAKEGDLFKFSDNNAMLLRVKNNHHWFYINEGLVSLFKKLKGKSVILVGGAENECLKDIFEALEAFKVNVKYNHNYIYSAETSNQEQHKIIK